MSELHFLQKYRKDNLRAPTSWRNKAGVFRIPDSEEWIVRVYVSKTRCYTTMSRHSTQEEAERKYKEYLAVRK